MIGRVVLPPPHSSHEPSICLNQSSSQFEHSASLVPSTHESSPVSVPPSQVPSLGHPWTSATLSCDRQWSSATSSPSRATPSASQTMPSVHLTQRSSLYHPPVGDAMP